MKLRILLISILFLAITGCQGEHPKKEQIGEQLPPVKVRVLTVTAQEAPLQTEVVGTVQPVDRAAIAAKVTGTIEKMPVVLGSQVKAGDLLVKISAGEISARVIQAQAQLEQARRNLAREKKLLGKNAATAENVKSLEDMFRVAEAVYGEAKTMLGYTTITAPFDGQITSKSANVGDLATPGTTLLQLEDNRKLQVVTSVPEALVLQISPGDTLPIHIPAADIDIHGRVAEIAPSVDPLSRTAAVKLDIEESIKLRSGQFARVALSAPRKDTLFVPASAVQVFGQMEKIFVVQENRALLRLVRTGAVMNGQVEILAGLEPGEIIVAQEGSQLIDGQPVILDQ
jgi:membrane fusion protein (multidrug efflux system)